MQAVSAPPRGFPGRLWVVVFPDGEKHFLTKEPLEGIAAWVKGVNATVSEYRFNVVTHTPPPKKKKAPSK